MNVSKLFINNIYIVLSYSLVLIAMDKIKMIKLKEPRYENIKLINYILWVVIALSSISFPNFGLTGAIFVSHSILFNFLYELIFYKPDTAHVIHHVLTTIGILVSYGLWTFPDKVVYTSANIFYVGMFSSIFSSLRKITNEKNKSSMHNIYKISYLIAKIGGIICHYKLILFSNYNLSTNNKILFFMHFLIHITQIYFCYLIVKKMVSKKVSCRV